MSKTSTTDEAGRWSGEADLLDGLILKIVGAKDCLEALNIFIREICDASGWVFGEVWLPDSQGIRLGASGAWHYRDEKLDKFRRISENIKFLKGQGIPGRVYVSKSPEWVLDVSREQDAYFLRAQTASETNLRTALGVPLLAGGEVFAVAVFFTAEPKEEDPVLVGAVERMAEKIGGLIMWKFNEDGLRTSMSALGEINGKTDVELKQAKVFEAVVRAAQLPIVITDTEPKIIYVNPAWERQNGYRLAEVRGKNPRILQSGKTPRAVYTEMWRELGAGRAFATREMINKRRDGTTYQLKHAIFPITEEGKTVFLAAIQQDISEHVELDRAKDEFISVASHQLGTPLTAISWYAEMLLGEKGTLTAKQARYLEEIYSSTRREIQLVTALLNVSRIDLGIFAIRPEEADIAKIAEQALNELRLKIEEKKLIVKKNFAASLPKISVDPHLTQIIFQNLISNAVKYTPEGGEINVGISRSAAGFLITVSDTGYGIPEGEQSKIFTKLFRASNVRTRETDGTGLGLYIVKAIAEKSGGRIWFESRENHGTTFNVEIPASGMQSREGVKVLDLSS